MLLFRPDNYNSGPFKIAKIKLEQEINSINDSKNSLQNQIKQLEEEINRENDIINDAEKF